MRRQLTVHKDNRCSMCVQFLQYLLNKTVYYSKLLNTKDILLGAIKHNLNTVSWKILVNIK